jgi:hypothetical protein
MGFNHCYIPNYNQLVEYYNSVDLETFVKRFKKYDSWSGDGDAMKFLENKIKEYEKVISDIDIGDWNDKLQKGNT